MVRSEIEALDLPGLSVALVDETGIVWAQGFGLARSDPPVPASAATVYRVGSVSKLFTDIALLQLVERGDVDLDAPVSSYLPEFRPENPYPHAEITLRSLLAHRSGLVREPPVGSYFDPSEPDLRAVVASLSKTRLVHPPGTRTKYSNGGIAVVGRVVEKRSGRPFAEAIEERVLRPLGLESSRFVASAPAVRQRLATGTMHTLAGRRFPAPEFALATSPAGNLYSTVTDLGRFVHALIGEGELERSGVLSRSTLESMWKIQYEEKGAARGYGLGFRISRFEGERRVEHGGAVYGFSTTLAALPESRVGVVVAISLDVANGVSDRIADHALRCLLAHRRGEPIPAPPVTRSLPPGLALRLAGRYERGDRRVELERDGDRLWLRDGPTRAELRQGESGLVVRGFLRTGPAVGVSSDRHRLTVGDREYERVEEPRPPPAPTPIAELVGDYGPDHDVLTLLERDGRLRVLIEWAFEYPLEPAGEDAYRFPSTGLYSDETLSIQRDAEGHPEAVVAGGFVFRRRPIGNVAGGTFRIDPLRPLPELRREALAATPPPAAASAREPDLVDLETFDPDLRLDVRYATSKNFLSTPFYPSARAFLQRPAARSLLRVHRALRSRGFGLLVFDAYRPWYVTKMFWDATPEALRDFVANPAHGSRHNRGCAIDLTLLDLQTGRAVEMPGGYDEFSPRSSPRYPGGTSRQRWHRRVLLDAMEAEEFRVYEHEWWHYDHRLWREFPVLDETFEELDARSRPSS